MRLRPWQQSPARLPVAGEEVICAGNRFTGPRRNTNRIAAHPDFEPARRKLGWEPKVPLDDGLKRAIDDFRASL